jgi:CMP/dCMP kinase
MKIITVSREYGAGGGEVARRVAEALGWQLLDRELLHEAAALEHLPDEDLQSLDEKALSVADRFRLHPPHQHYIHGLREAVRRAAARRHVVLVGRGTRQLLAETEEAFHLRLVAPREWRAGRMAKQEGWSLEYALARCTEVDRTRERFTRYFFGVESLQPAQYDLVVNTGRVPLDDVVGCLVALVRDDLTSRVIGTPPRQRVSTLSRELGAGDTGFAPTLGSRLGLRVYDRELLEQEATRLGVKEAELEQIDEQPASIFQRFRPGSLYQRYFDALGQLLRELATRGNVLLVGRGGNFFLRDQARAFHVRLVAPMDVRVRRVMEHRWLREKQARQLITQSDAQRRTLPRATSARTGPTLWSTTSRSTAAAWDQPPWTLLLFWPKPVGQKRSTLPGLISKAAIAQEKDRAPWKSTGESPPPG